MTNEIRCTRPFGREALSVDGQVVPLAPSLKLRNHSPTGFSWGYEGSGCAQTAFAILLHVTGDALLTARHYQTFKREHVARWPQDADVVEHLDVAGYLATLEEFRKIAPGLRAAG